MKKPSVAVVDPGCLSRILIFTSRVQKQQQKRREINCWPIGTFFCSHKYQKLKLILFFNWWRKKFWTSLQRITERFYQKYCHKALRNMAWVPGSEIRVRKKPISDPGSRMQASDPGSWSTTLKKPYKTTTPAGWGSTATGCCGCPTCTGERAGPTSPRLSRPLWTLQQASSSKVGTEPGIPYLFTIKT